MEKEYTLTKDDYKSLFSGKVRYLITKFQKFNYGRGNLECFQYYSIITTIGGGQYNLPAWSTEDTKKFIKEHNLQNGDRVTIYYISPNNSKIGYWSPGGGEYMVLYEDFIKIEDYLGA